jgi:hypothetical protein
LRSCDCFTCSPCPFCSHLLLASIRQPTRATARSRTNRCASLAPPSVRPTRWDARSARATSIHNPRHASTTSWSTRSAPWPWAASVVRGEAGTGRHPRPRRSFARGVTGTRIRRHHLVRERLSKRRTSRDTCRRPHLGCPHQLRPTDRSSSGTTFRPPLPSSE